MSISSAEGSTLYPLLLREAFTFTSHELNCRVPGSKPLCLMLGVIRKQFERKISWKLKDKLRVSLTAPDVQPVSKLSAEIIMQIQAMLKHDITCKILQLLS